MDVEVGRICLDLEELIVGRHSRCDGLPLLPLDSESMNHHATEGMNLRYWALDHNVSHSGESKATQEERRVFRSQSTVVVVEHSRVCISIRRHKMWDPSPGVDAPRSEPLTALRQFSMQDPGFEVPRIYLSRHLGE